MLPPHAIFLPSLLISMLYLMLSIYLDTYAQRDIIQIIIIRIMNSCSFHSNHPSTRVSLGSIVINCKECIFCIKFNIFCGTLFKLYIKRRESVRTYTLMRVKEFA